MKALSKTLPVIALSSGEAELGAILRASTEGFGMRSFAGDVGLQLAQGPIGCCRCYRNGQPPGAGKSQALGGR